MYILCSCNNHMASNTRFRYLKVGRTRYTKQDKILWIKESNEPTQSKYVPLNLQRSIHYRELGCQYGGRVKPTRMNKCMFSCILNLTYSTASSTVDLGEMSHRHTSGLDQIRNQSQSWWTVELLIRCWKKATNPHRWINVCSAGSST